VSQTFSFAGRRAAKKVREKFQQVPGLLRRVRDLLRRAAAPLLRGPFVKLFNVSRPFRGAASGDFPEVSVLTKVKAAEHSPNFLKNSVKKCFLLFCFV
jgi:hypothetical protein